MTSLLFSRILCTVQAREPANLNQIPRSLWEISCPVCLSEGAMTLKIDRKGRFYYSCSACPTHLFSLDLVRIWRVALVSSMADGAGLSTLRDRAYALSRKSSESMAVAAGIADAHRSVEVAP